MPPGIFLLMNRPVKCYSLVNMEELKLLFYPNPTPLNCTGSWRQSSVHSVHCRLRCLLFREEDAYTYLPGASLNVVVKINLIFPGIELQSLNSVLLLSWIPLFLNGGGGAVFSVKWLDWGLCVQGGGGRRRMPSIMRPDRLWGPPSIPFSGFRDHFRWGKLTGSSNLTTLRGLYLQFLLHLPWRATGFHITVIEGSEYEPIRSIDMTTIIGWSSLYRAWWRWEASCSSETQVGIYRLFHHEEDPNIYPYLHGNLKYHEVDQIPSRNNSTYHYAVTNDDTIVGI